ncbi:MAG: LysR family transcriptional regulator [Arenimonas sp.]|nr:LysR family transcriptional regulator [Arenimonas sp.]MBP6309409.1 LysR family transcriptional regulator [Arenimonas sp.]
MKRLPSLRLLIGFEAAARLGSYSRAADELCLSQSAISHQIAHLEKNIGQSLFRRIGRGVELTMAGNSLFQTVSQSLELMGNGLERINTYLNPGLVVIICPAPISQGWLLAQLQQLQNDIPSLSPLISTDESARYVDEDDVDIAISYRPLQQAQILEQEFLADRMVCIASAELSTKLARLDIKNHSQHCKLLCLENEILNAKDESIFKSHFANWDQRMMFDDIRLIIAACVQGHGLAYVSELAAYDAIQSGQVSILPDYPTQSMAKLWVSMRRGESRTPLIAQLYKQLIEIGHNLQ